MLPKCKQYTMLPQSLPRLRLPGEHQGPHSLFNGIGSDQTKIRLLQLKPKYHALQVFEITTLGFQFWVRFRSPSTMTVIE